MNAAELCMALMRADRQADVIGLLTDAGYWNDPTCWRYLGDNENNFSSIGNQQSEAVAALIEKIVNAVDARLTNACYVAGVEPESDAAPNPIREAVARFFEGRATFDPGKDGRISAWPDAKATSEGRLLTVTATGYLPDQGDPSISIADAGEGQTPDAFAETFLSLHHRLSPHGSLVKLYEYGWKGSRSNIVASGGGLLRRLDVGLPELALPVRVFE